MLLKIVAFVLLTIKTDANALPIHTIKHKTKAFELDKALTTLSEKVQTLSLKEPTLEVLDSLVAIYNSMVEDSPIPTLPPSPLQAQLTASILQKTAEILGNVSLSDTEPLTANASDMVMTVVKTVDPHEIEWMENFNGDLIYEADGFGIYSMCLVSKYRYAGLVIYQSNKSPFRKLPKTDFPIKNFQVFDLIHVNVKKAPNWAKECTEKFFFEMVQFSWQSQFDPLAWRTGCAQWMEAIRDWSSENCLVYSYTNINEVFCYCDTRNNSQTTQYIFYEYLEDLDRTFFHKFNQVFSPLTDVGSPLVKIKALAQKPANSIDFKVFACRYLSKILYQDTETIKSLRNTTLNADIGKILADVRPDNGDGMVGCVNEVVNAFVVLPRSYQHDPLIAFSIFSNHSMKVMYYRSKDNIDANLLFNNDKEFSVLFSESVVRQNERYGIVIFPENKHFSPPVEINSYKVLTSRVVDVITVPFDNIQGDREQLIHMFFNPTWEDTAVQQHGCAYWSARHDRWTTSGCFINTVLYREVCTCSMTSNFQEARTRGQYVGYRYLNADFHEYDAGALSEYYFFDFFALSVLGIHETKYYPNDFRTVNKMLTLLMRIQFNEHPTLRYTEKQTQQLIHDARELLKVSDCVTDQLQYTANSMGVFCINTSVPNPVTAFSYDAELADSITHTFSHADFNASQVYSRVTLFAGRLSDSVIRANGRCSILIYPTRMFWRQRPKISHMILSSRVVDVVLVPKTEDVDVEQFVELYLSPGTYNASMGCAFWSDALDDWTSIGCHVFKVSGLDVCNCSLSDNFYQSRSGGQYIAFTFTEAVFDEDVYTRLGSASLSEDSELFGKAFELIRNASRIPIDDELLIKVLQIYVRILSTSDSSFAEDHRDHVREILNALELIFSRYHINCAASIIKRYGIQGAWSAKNAAVANDLFTNAVLTNNATEEVTMTSDMTLVLLGYMSDENDDNRSNGFYIVKNVTEVLTLANGFVETQVVASAPQFACLLPLNDTVQRYRLVFTLYPINLSPYPLTMTSNSLFNVRQVDVYIDTGNDKCRDAYEVFESMSDEAPLDVFFNPTEEPKGYIKMACASWSDPQGSWTDDVCEIDPDTYGLCHCTLTNRSVTRIIMYEYTDLANFALSTKFDGPKIVYLFSASLSYVGLVSIAATALMFKKWRRELGNKIMMQLSASLFAYLTLTTFRETHEIFADSNHNNYALIVFAVLVHYTRLTHYCWGLVMSFLQYMRFSGVVGALKIPRLLLKVSLVAWGAPLVPLVILLLWDQKVHFCSPNKITHLVLYLVPGVAITLIEIGLMLAIVYNITNKFGCGKEDDLQRHGLDEKDLLKRRLKTLVLMFFLFGIPAIFEMFNNLGSHSEAVDYIGKFLDPIQGFVLFLFFVVLDERTRGFWYVKFYGEQAFNALRRQTLNARNTRSMRNNGLSRGTGTTRTAGATRNPGITRTTGKTRTTRRTRA